MLITELNTPFTDIVRENCSNAWNSNISLFRGMRVMPFKNEFIRDIRQDRMPRDSSQLYANLFNWYCEALGYPHRKQNTLSTSVKVQQAAGYGITVYQIFPFDNAQYLFSPIHYDFFDVSERIEAAWLTWDGRDVWHGKTMSQVSEDYVRAFINDNLEQLDAQIKLYCTPDINEVKSNGEVLVYGTQYAALFRDHLSDWTPD